MYMDHRILRECQQYVIVLMYYHLFSGKYLDCSLELFNWFESRWKYSEHTSPISHLSIATNIKLVIDDILFSACSHFEIKASLVNFTIRDDIPEKTSEKWHSYCPKVLSPTSWYLIQSFIFRQETADLPPESRQNSNVHSIVENPLTNDHLTVVTKMSNLEDYVEINFDRPEQ